MRPSKYISRNSCATSEEDVTAALAELFIKESITELAVELVLSLVSAKFTIKAILYI